MKPKRSMLFLAEGLMVALALILSACGVTRAGDRGSTCGTNRLINRARVGRL